MAQSQMGTIGIGTTFLPECLASKRGWDTGGEFRIDSSTPNDTDSYAVQRQAANTHAADGSRHSPAARPSPLKLAHFLEAAVPRVAEHDVIHQVDAHHHTGRRQPPRQLVIVRARRGIPRRMVVDNQDRRRNRAFY